MISFIIWRAFVCLPFDNKKRYDYFMNKQHKINPSKEVGTVESIYKGHLFYYPYKKIKAIPTPNTLPPALKALIISNPFPLSRIFRPSVAIIVDTERVEPKPIPYSILKKQSHPKLVLTAKKSPLII